MGDKKDKVKKGLLLATGPVGASYLLAEEGKKMIQAPVKLAKAAAARQQEQIARQSQKERIKLAEADDAIARKRGLATRAKGGRASLLATSPTGAMNTTLGGT